MPTDLSVYPRENVRHKLKRKPTSFVLVCFIIILVNLLLFVDQGFAKALELMGQLGS